MHEELAIINNVSVGMRDAPYPNLSFTTSALSGSALQVIGWDQAGILIKENDISNIKNLDGKACIVSVGNGYQKFVRLFKPF